MHSYLRAIGFSQLKKESEVEKLLADVYHNFEHRDAIRDENTAFIELEKDYAPDLGIMLCGAIDKDGFPRSHCHLFQSGLTGQ